MSSSLHARAASEIPGQSAADQYEVDHRPARAGREHRKAGLMQETETKTVTPTRRAALRFSLACAGAGRAMARAAPDVDAGLIALCAIVAEQEAARQALYAVRHTLAEEQRTGPALQALYTASEQAVDRLMALPPPSTIAGLRAMARAAVAIAPRDWDGAIMPQGDAEWLAFAIATVLANGAAA